MVSASPVEAPSAARTPARLKDDEKAALVRWLRTFWRRDGGHVGGVEHMLSTSRAYELVLIDPEILRDDQHDLRMAQGQEW